MFQGPMKWWWLAGLVALVAIIYDQSQPQRRVDKSCIRNFGAPGCYEAWRDTENPRQDYRGN